MSRRLFGTDGIRGTAGQYPVDETGAWQLGRAVAAEMAPGGAVAIGRDSRPSGVGLSAAIVDGLRQGGCDVVDLGLVPTPAVAWYVAAHGAAAGIAVSASHNPAGENGFKLFGPRGEKVTEALEARVERAMARSWPASAAPGRLQVMADAAERYVDFALGTVPAGVDLHGLKIAVDCARGATAGTTPAALTRLGAEVITTCCEPDGARINDACGSLHPETVQALAREHSANLGLAHDGDGDRLVLIDERGELLCGDRILGLTAAVLGARGELNGGHVVGTILSNIGLEHWLRDRGLNFHRSEVGDRNVWTMMRRHNADLGGEPSGHTILRRLSHTDDALLTALHVLSLKALSGRDLHDLAADIPLVPQLTANLRVHRKPPLESLPPVCDAVNQAQTLLRDNGRMVLRYSGTEAVVRILVEGPDTSLLRQVTGLLSTALHTAGIAA